MCVYDNTSYKRMDVESKDDVHQATVELASLGSPDSAALCPN